MSGDGLAREMADAGLGVGRLLSFDPRWTEGFNPTVAGFVRSFLGPVLSLPFTVLVTGIYAKAQGFDVDGHPLLLWAATASQVFSIVAFPLVMGVLAKPLGYGEGFAGFVIVTNWASLFVTVAMTGASVLTLFGKVGLDLFQTVNFAILCLSVFITWRAARETLSAEFGPPTLAVVLWVAVIAASNQVAAWVAPGLVDLGG